MHTALSMETKFTSVEVSDKTKVICDTNVWYGFCQGRTTVLNENQILIPTSLTLVELAISEVLAHDIKLFQCTIKAIYDRGGPIIPEDPIDYVLSQQDPKFKPQERGIKDILHFFSQILSLDFSKNNRLDDKLKHDIIENSKNKRQARLDFADLVNSKINEIRKNINISIGKEQHLQIDTTDLIKSMTISIFNKHVQETGYNIDWENFDWKKIELFTKVTERFFKKIETTKDMKISPNDAVDWMNLLYVEPTHKYLTFEEAWRNYIKEDERIRHYLYD